MTTILTDKVCLLLDEAEAAAMGGNLKLASTLLFQVEKTLPAVGYDWSELLDLANDILEKRVDCLEFGRRLKKWVALVREDEEHEIGRKFEELVAKHEYGKAAALVAEAGNLHSAHQTVLDGLRFEEFERIARKHGVETLKTRGSDSLDFVELGVAGIFEMMVAAFEYGRTVERSPVR